mgnify:CR=1 FL=1
MLVAKDAPTYVKNIIKNIRSERGRTNSLKSGGIWAKVKGDFHANIAVTLKLH